MNFSYWKIHTNYTGECPYLVQCTQEELRVKQKEYINEWVGNGNKIEDCIFCYSPAKFRTLNEVKMPTKRQRYPSRDYPIQEFV